MAERTKGRNAGKDVLRALAEALAPYLGELHPANPSKSPAYYSQADSPLGRRRHLELARSGRLRARKVGRMVLVAREDVHAFIEAHAEKSGPSPNCDNDALSDWGLVARKRR